MINKIRNLNCLQSSQTGQSPSKRTAFKMVPSTFEPPQPIKAQSQFYNEINTTQPLIRPIVQQNSQFLDQNYQPPPFPFQKYPSDSLNPHANIQFISHLLSNALPSIPFSKDQSIPLSNDKWLVISGCVRVIGINGCWFERGQGFLFFGYEQNQNKIQKVEAIVDSTLWRIEQKVYKQSLANYMYLKNAQKMNIFTNCPILAWTHCLCFDIALSTDLVTTYTTVLSSQANLHTNNQLIYQQHDQADYLYFVKEGVVLLERGRKAGDQAILKFEQNYETNYVGDDEGIVVVRRGMMFGADGILVKEIGWEGQKSESMKQFGENEGKGLKQILKTTRIYNAKTLGKCELYRTHKSVLETYLKHHNDMQCQTPSLIHSKQLNRLSLQYTNLLMGSTKIMRQVKRTSLEFNVREDSKSLQLERKKRKVEEEKQAKKSRVGFLVKKVGDNESSNKYKSLKQIKSMGQIENPKLGKLILKIGNEGTNKVKQSSLPCLQNKYIQNLIMKKLETRQEENYMNYKKKIEGQLFGSQRGLRKLGEEPSKQVSKLWPKKIRKTDNKSLDCMKVRSYGNLMGYLK